jgi:heme exporter protein A
VRLSVDNLACRRSGRRIFSGLAFALGPGDALAVTGRNGAGKSSLLAILSGRLRPDAGRITVADVGEASLPECLHVVGHRDGLKSSLTAGENLHFARTLLGAPRLFPAEALAQLGLGHAHDLPVAYLSAGQRRRVALARLLVCARPLWRLDEPTAALDTASQAVLAGLMAAHRAAGGLVIAATHQALGLDGAAELPIEAAAPQAPEPLEDWA